MGGQVINQLNKKVNLKNCPVQAKSESSLSEQLFSVLDSLIGSCGKVGGEVNFLYPIFSTASSSHTFSGSPGAARSTLSVLKYCTMLACEPAPVH